MLFYKYKFGCNEGALLVFNKKTWKNLPKFELTKPQNGDIITLLSDAERLYGSEKARLN